MPKQDLFIQSYFLATRENTLGRFLSTGKILLDNLSGSSYFYLLEISPESPSAKIVFDKVTDTLRKYSHLDAINESNFEKVINKINSELKDFADQGHNDWLGKFNAIVGIIDKNDIYLSQCGNIVGYIFRKNRISSLTDASKTNTNIHALFDDITSGQIITDDRIVFGNTEFFARISLDRTRRLGTERSLLEDLLPIQKHFQRQKSCNSNAIFFEADCLPPEDDIIETLYLDEPEVTKLDEFITTAKPYAKKFYDGIQSACKVITKYFLSGTKKSYKYASKKLRPQFEKYSTNLSKAVKNNLKDLEKNNQYFKSVNLGNPTGIKIRNNSYVSHKRKTGLTNIILAYATLIKPLFQKKNRRYLYAILVVLAVIIIFGKISANNSSRSNIASKNDLAISYDRAKSLYETGKQDVALGKSSGKVTLADALTEAQKAKDYEPNRDKSLALIKDIQSVFDKLIGAKRIYANSVSIDLPEKTRMVISVGNEIFSVCLANEIYRGTYNNYTAEKVAAFPEGAGSIEFLTYSSYLKKLYVYSTNNIAYALNLEAKSLDIASQDASVWEDAATFLNYKSNLYLLDPDGNQIWKHSGSNEGFGAGSKYIRSSKTSVANAVDAAVDGSFFVLSSDGSVSKIYQGSVDSNFKMKNTPSPDNSLSGATKIFTDEDTVSIFVLDTPRNRVVRYNKSGDYQDQFIIDGASLKDFAVNSKLQKMWLLADNKLFEITL